MKKALFLLILSVFSMVSAVSSEIQKKNVTPQNVTELQAEFKAASASKMVWTVSHPDFIDWKSVQPGDYEKIYEQISGDFFQSRFSMKYGFRPEPFFPLLFPQTPELTHQVEPTVLEKITQIKSGINQVLHEIHTEFFLQPLLAWSSEKHILIEYNIQAEPEIPAVFLIEEALLVHHVSSSANEGFSYRLAASLARQNGNLTLNQQPVSYPRERTVLLFPDSTTCNEIENISKDFDFLAEFQIRYATTQFTSGQPTVGWGAASWNTVQLLMVREAYRQETREFLARFERLGGKILEISKKMEKNGEKE